MIGLFFITLMNVFIMVYNLVIDLAKCLHNIVPNKLDISNQTITVSHL